MRIPVSDGPRAQTRPIGTPFSNTNFDTGQGEVSRGIGELGTGIDRAAHYVAQAEDKANALAANDLVTQFQHDTTTELVGDTGAPSTVAAPGKLGETGEQGFSRPTSRPGFLSSRGKAAFEQSGDALSRLEKRRQKIAESATNDKQRALFMQHSASLFEGARARVEGHTAEQLHAAEAASIEGRKAETLRDISSAYSDDKWSAQQAAGVEQVIRAFALSPEDAQAKAAAWQSDVAKMRLEKFLAAKDAKGAENLFAAVKDKLEPHVATRFEKDIGAVRLDREADAKADALVKGSRSPDGRFDAKTAYDQVDGITDSDLANEVRVRVQRREMVEDRLWADHVKDVGTKAYQQHNIGGFGSIPGPLKQELNRVDPALYDRLKDDAARKYRQSKQDGGAARREQAMLNRIGLQDFMARPPASRADADVDLEYAGMGLDEVGIGAIRVKQRLAKEAIRKDGAESESEFVRQAKASAVKIVRGKESQKVFDAEAALAYSKLEADLKRAPSNAEAEKAISDLTLKAITKPGAIYGFNEEYEFERRARERKDGTGATKKLAPGRYKDKKSGKTIIVDELGNKRFE